MTEYDSASSSDTSSGDWSSPSDRWPSSEDSASPASESASHERGFDASPLVQTFVELLVDADTAHQDLPARTDGAQHGSLLKESIQALLLAGAGTRADERSVVRRIVEANRWFVPVRPDGAFVRLAAVPDSLSGAFLRPLEPGGRERGRPGQVPTSVVVAYEQQPSPRAQALSGRALVRSLRGDVGGLLLLQDARGDASTAIGFRQAELPLLTQLADSLDLEMLLMHPRPGQVKALQQARWYVPADNVGLAPSPPGYGDPTIYVYTHPDRGEQTAMVELDGLTLCKQLAGRSDFVELCVNPSRPVGLGADALDGLSLPPSFVRGIARGIDLRPGAEPLPARTLVESILWLDLHRFPWEGREIVAAPTSVAPPSGTVPIQFRATGTSAWRLVGKGYQSKAPAGPTLSPVFALARPAQLPNTLPAPIPPPFVTVYGGHLNPDVSALSAASLDLGDGPTQILCAGLLAQKLYERDHWQPSGWFVSKKDRLLAVRYASWAAELLKLIPPGQDRLPRSSVLSIEGTRFLHGRPEFRERAWIERQHARHARSASRRFNFGG